MRDTLKQLLQLQRLDEEITRRSERLEAIPNEIDQLKTKLEKERMRGQEVTENLKSTKVKRKETEGRIEHLESTLQKYQNQLLEVKTNEEYTALLHEIEGVKGNIRELEEEVLEYMEEIEALESELDTVMKDLKETEETHQNDTKALIEEKGRVEEEIVRIRDERKNLASMLRPVAIKRYERVRSAISKLPIAEVIEGGFCGGCYAQITLQRQAEIKKNAELMSCENCGRIIYYRDNLDL